MSSPTRRRRATRVAAVAALLTVAATAGLSGSPAGASPRDELAQKQRLAGELEAKLSATNERISVLDEQYNQAQLAIEAASDGIADTQRRFDAATSRSEALKVQLRARAAALYVGSGNGSPADVLDLDDVGELSSRSKYGAAAADEDEGLIDDLTVAKEQLDAARAEFERARADGESRQASLSSTRADIDRAQRDQQALLADVQGDVADLVAQLEAEQRAEEEARARAEAQRRARTDAAPRAAPAASGGKSRGSRPGPPVVAPAPNGGARTAVDTALAQLGKPYRYAAVGPGSFDCSGLTMYAWAAAGVRLPHSSAAQYAGLPHVAQDQLAPGDLLFYGSPIHHVGMYIGNGQYVHAPQTGDVVKVSTIFRRDYAGAARPG
jgi:cell wall-associated NlpC family hydrolase